MEILRYLTITMFILWCGSEISIRLISYINRSRTHSEEADKFSLLILNFLAVLPIGFALLVWADRLFANGFGSFSNLSLLLGYVGCLVIVFGITIRLLSVAALKKQFTVQVSIVQEHKLVDIGIYGKIRHPAYLGFLVSLFGIGLASGNWVSLILLVVLPLGGILYRIHVEEKALARYFNSEYQAYASRTKRLLPGIW